MSVELFFICEHEDTLSTFEDLIRSLPFDGMHTKEEDYTYSPDGKKYIRIVPFSNKECQNFMEDFLEYAHAKPSPFERGVVIPYTYIKRTYSNIGIIMITTNAKPLIKKTLKTVTFRKGNILIYNGLWTFFSVNTILSVIENENDWLYLEGKGVLL